MPATNPDHAFHSGGHAGGLASRRLPTLQEAVGHGMGHGGQGSWGADELGNLLEYLIPPAPPGTPFPTGAEVERLLIEFGPLPSQY